VIGGEFLEAFPEQFARSIGDAKVGITFVVEQGVLPEDLKPERTNDLAFGIFHDLKFGQALFQIICRQAHGRPNRLERGTVVHGGAADAQDLRAHGYLPGYVYISETLWQFQREI
jgi:hypothetical protein